MSVPETKLEPLDPKVRRDAIGDIERALMAIAPLRADMREALNVARDVARDTIDAFLIELEGKR